MNQIKKRTYVPHLAGTSDLLEYRLVWYCYTDITLPLSILLDLHSRDWSSNKIGIVYYVTFLFEHGLSC